MLIVIQIHIFPEGKVNQHKMNPAGGLFRFKWGVGRIIMDSKIMPEIIPMWISGSSLRRTGSIRWLGCHRRIPELTQQALIRS